MITDINGDGMIQRDDYDKYIQVSLNKTLSIITSNVHPF